VGVNPLRQKMMCLAASVKEKTVVTPPKKIP